MFVAELDFEVRKVKPFKSGKGAFLSGLIRADVPERSGIWARYKTFGGDGDGIRRVPDVGSVSPIRILMSVVLPAPFGPRNPNISPFSTSRLMSLNAWTRFIRSPER